MPTTYLLDGSGGTNSDLTPALYFNKKALATRIDATQMEYDILKTTVDEIGCSWSTEAGIPGLADWPSGDYKGSININSWENTTNSIKIQLVLVQSNGTIRATLGTSGAITGTGPQTYTINTDPASGANTDRYQLRILGSVPGHGNLWVRFDFDANSYISGPWAAAQGYSEEAKALAGLGIQTLGRTIVFSRPLDAPTGVSSTISKLLGIFREGIAQVGLATAISHVRGALESLSTTFGLATTSVKRGIGKGILATVGLVSSREGLSKFQRALSLIVVGLGTSFRSMSRILPTSVGLVSDFGRLVGFRASLGASTGLSLVIQRTLGLLRDLVTSTGLAPLVGKGIGLIQSFTIGLANTISRSVEFTRALVPTTGLGLGYLLKRAFVRVLSLVLGLLSAESRELTFARVKPAALGFASTISRNVGSGRALSSAVGLVGYVVKSVVSVSATVGLVVSHTWRTVHSRLPRGP